jgi:membrane-bound metal-dependent hydrolase YbcI (DUF457 family)
VPITPFHFGPGAAIHAVAPRHVSFLAFCAANVLIDVEPGYYMLTAQYPLHRFFHTYVGATLVAVASVALVLGARAIASPLRIPDFFEWRSLKVSQVGIGAVIGVYSHVALDSLMHADIRPFAPFSQANPLYHLISMGTLHLSCVVGGAGGLLLLGLRHLARRP